MGNIKQLVRVAVQGIPRLESLILGREWPAHDHHDHAGLEDDDHPQYLPLTAGSGRQLTDDLYCQGGIVGNPALDLSAATDVSVDAGSGNISLTDNHLQDVAGIGYSLVNASWVDGEGEQRVDVSWQDSEIQYLELVDDVLEVAFTSNPNQRSKGLILVLQAGDGNFTVTGWPENVIWMEPENAGGLSPAIREIPAAHFCVFSFVYLKTPAVYLGTVHPMAGDM